MGETGGEVRIDGLRRVQPTCRHVCGALSGDWSADWLIGWLVGWLKALNVDKHFTSRIVVERHTKLQNNVHIYG